MLDTEAIDRIVTKTFSDEFKHIRLLMVVIYEEDTDCDGDAVLRIYVVYEGAPEALDARKLLGVIRQLRLKLEEIHPFVLPLFSFISRADLKGLPCMN